MNKEDATKIIKTYEGPSIKLMEVCGTHTHEIYRLGIRKILPSTIKLVSGPGCPVCVTPNTYIDEAIMLGLNSNVVICTFGDLIRVPGKKKNLMDARAEGVQVKIVYSPSDALDYAIENPEKEVVFLSVGFETTTPAICLAVKYAKERSVSNFSVLTANKTMSEVYLMLRDCADIFLYPGHVHAITGEYTVKEMVNDNVSGVIMGFTSEEILDAIATAIEKSKKNKPFFENCYTRVVKPKGNRIAQELMNTVMQKCDSDWRGLGCIAGSGMKLSEKYLEYDARIKFSLPTIETYTDSRCRCGEVLQGKINPYQCENFGVGCKPFHPLGACMVSTEGTCAAYYKYGIENEQ